MVYGVYAKFDQGAAIIFNWIATITCKINFIFIVTTVFIINVKFMLKVLNIFSHLVLVQIEHIFMIFTMEVLWLQLQNTGDGFLTTESQIKMY